MVFDKQHQKAGDNSLQIQTGPVEFNNNFGISEERVRAIYDERLRETLRELTLEAREIACHRNQLFANDLIPKLVKAELLDAFKDPGFQMLLSVAQKSAASTERSADYELLTELLIHRVKTGEDRSAKAGIRRAVEIVDEISNDALLSLTVSLTVLVMTSKEISIRDALDMFDKFFGKIIYDPLPRDYHWIDHLDLLNCIRIRETSHSIKMREVISEHLEGYVSEGIRKGSHQHQRAWGIIGANGLPINDFLVPHEINDGYLRIPVARKAAIQELRIPDPNHSDGFSALSDEQLEVMHNVYELYCNVDSPSETVLNRFMSEWDSRPNLRKLREWWDGIPSAFNVTYVGIILAYANVQRYCPGLPWLQVSFDTG